MKTKNRTLKALCVVILVGFGLFQNLTFETASMNTNSDESNKNYVLESETKDDWSETFVYIIKTVSTSIKYLTLTF